MTSRAPEAAPYGDALPDPARVCAEAAVSGYPDLIRPHPDWGLERIAWLIDEAFEGRGPLRLGRQRSLVVLAVDAVGLDLADALSPTGRSVLTSTFPSTSVVAWRTALTGVPPHEHMVPGVVYRDPSTGLLYHSFRDRVMRHSTRWEDAPPAEPGICFPASETIFSRLGRRGVHTVAVAGDLLTLPSRWQRDLLAGADVEPPRTSLDPIRFDPEALAELTVEQVDVVLRARHRGSQRLTWAWINLDDPVHRLGPSADVRHSLELLDRAANRWATAGHAVLLHSDHGMTPCSVSPRLEEAWDRVNGMLSRLPPGGAGRTRWCFPRPGRRIELMERLAEILDPRTLIGAPEELAALGLLPTRDPSIGKRVGEVVVVARTAAFPATMAALYEHGGANAEEMLVPVAWWEP